MSYSFSLAPFWPLWVLAALGTGAVLLVGLSFYLRRRGTLWRAVALALLFLALLNPIMLQEDRKPLSSVVALVVDRSQSQTLADRKSITDEAKALAEQQLAALAGFETRVIETDLMADSDGTMLFEAMRRGLADVPSERLGGVLLITDGQVHDIPATAAPGLSAPLHALITGTAKDRDRRLVLTQTPRFGIVGQAQAVSFKLEDRGTDGAVAQAMVTIRRDGEDIERRTVTTGRDVTIYVPITHAGSNIVEIEAEALAGELTAINNNAVVMIEGIREKLRVLLVSGEPHAGERTWRNLLKADAQVDLVHFTILRPPEKQDGTPINELALIAFPTRELFQDKIRDFDLIIFDRYAQQGILPLAYFDNIANYVRRGGALLVAAGPEHASSASIQETSLEDILPVAPSGVIRDGPFRPLVSEAGRKHPVTRQLPGAAATPPQWSPWHRYLEARSARGTSLLEGPDKAPLLTLDRVGEGRAAIFMSDQIWLWARGYEGGGPHRELMRRLAHWLMKEPQLEEEALRLSARGRMLTVERQTMADSADAVTLHGPAGTERSLLLSRGEDGVWRGSTELDALGLWKASSGTLSSLVHIGPTNMREFADVTSSTALLAPLARATQGSVNRISDTNRVEIPRFAAISGSKALAGDGWIGFRQRDAAAVTGVSLWPVLSGLLGLIILLGGVLSLWLREAR